MCRLHDKDEKIRKVKGKKRSTEIKDVQSILNSH